MSTGLAAESECTPCDGGKYCPTTGLTAPTGNCTVGFYCLNFSSSATPTDGIMGDVCPAGHYCKEGTAVPPECADGDYAVSTQNAACLPCPERKHCTDKTNPVDCPAGFYCPAQTGMSLQPCPVGTFSSSTGLKEESQCTNCTGGFYCAVQNLTAVSGPCEPGYYCRSGSSDSMPTLSSGADAGPCPVGHYCEQQTQDPQPCPAGSFNNQTMITSLSECQDCTPGYYCDAPALDWPTGLCNAGFYCTSSSDSASPSTVTATGGPCPVGKYCVTGTSVPVDCAAGNYNDIEQQFECKNCSAGYHCTSGSSSQTDCPKGMCIICLDKAIPSCFIFVSSIRSYLKKMSYLL